MSDYRCCDCGVETVLCDPPHHNYYMVHDHLWDQYGVGRGFLCIIDLEKRIGRRLMIDDLSDASINYMTGVREFLAERASDV